jgi:hypothetical protein
MLQISGLVAGEQWSVYTLAGVLVAESSGEPLRSPYAQRETANVKLPSNGIYIVKAGNRAVQVKN